MKRLIGLVLSLALLSATSLASSPVNDLSDTPRNWDVPPYWSPPAAAPADQSARAALATGLEPLVVTTPTPLPFVAITPCRIIDTRVSQGFPSPWGPPSLVGFEGERTFPIQNRCGIPVDAKAVSFNMTIFNPAALGNLRFFPAGSVLPLVSTINWPAGIRSLANAAIVPLGPSGLGGDGITVHASTLGALDFIADVNGYYSPLGLVNSLNGQAGDLNLVAGTNVSITPSANALTISAGTTGGPPTGPAGGALTGTYPNPGLAGSFAGLAANTFTATQTISSGNLDLPSTSGSTAGVLTLGGQPFLHASGSPENTFVGTNAGGGFATTGIANAGFGTGSLFSNTTGQNNAAFGSGSLQANTSGFSNAAFGTDGLASNTTGGGNAAFGAASLFSNTTGGPKAAFGANTLFFNTTGGANAAFGVESLFSNTTGDGNIAIGFNAGSLLTTGDNNIDIGHLGVAAEAGTIRIGTIGTQTRTFIAGISGVATVPMAVSVVIDANGQLGTIISSRRFKDDIADMDAASSALMSLRPVTFHYKTDQSPSGRTLQYGLIAEEVAEVYPGLVARSADGQIETVLYQFLPPMLLNEYQKQQRTIETQTAALAEQAARFDTKASSQQAEIAALRATLMEMGARLARAEARFAETR